MSTIALIYSTHDGQTLKICQRLAQRMQANDQQTSLLSLADCSAINWQEYDQVILGASIRYGHLNKALYQFIETNKESLNQINNAFFCVNLTARKPEKNTPETNAYMKKFLTLSSWQPQKLAVFAGALLYSKYGFFDKFMIRLIMKITGGETDTSKDIEYTDWDKVDQYADELLASLT
ncbi:MAG: protoporphyrinogen oxidase [Gammaproteobacteria bacterium MedPE]|nr:MAG: protoporphyrinogen oxidase [Gammaproteobacteria bacterium MedPE]